MPAIEFRLVPYRMVYRPANVPADAVDPETVIEAGGLSIQIATFMLLDRLVSIQTDEYEMDDMRFAALMEAIATATREMQFQFEHTVEVRNGDPDGGFDLSITSASRKSNVRS